MDPAFLVIGIGNTLRRDDGAGWLFAQALVDALRGAGTDVELILQQQLTPELAELVAELGATQVIFVDASTECTAVTLARVPEVAAGAPASHHLAPATILAIARRLYGAEAIGWLVHLPAYEFSHGEGLSDQAAFNMNRADATVTELLVQTILR